MKDGPSPLEAGKQALAERDRERALGILTPLATRVAGSRTDRVELLEECVAGGLGLYVTF